jgi:hypothetical protein
MQKRKILVLVHKDDSAFVYFKYLIKLLMKHWEDFGLAVEVARGIDRFVSADVVIPHLDMTIIPDEYREFLAHYPSVINRDVVDISKSRISANILCRDDSHTGPVIIKTDFNSGGLPEKRLSSRMYLLRALCSKLSGAISSRPKPGLPDFSAWAQVKYLNTSDYPVFPSLQEVPREIFENKNLVVEKFLPEVQDGWYCVRYYHFLGDEGVSELFRSKQEIVKGSDSGELIEAPVPPELHAIRQRLGMDYGKIDYVLREGKVVLLDVNRTPGIYGKGKLVQKISHVLATGILSKLN